MSALELIQDNLQTKNPYLDLGKCGLNGTEPELQLLEQCTHLETLVFSNEWWEFDEEKKEYTVKYSRNEGELNKLTQIPSCLPKSLQKLVLTGNWGNEWLITDISSLPSLTGLTRLDLRSNQITDISSLPSLTGLTRLDLDHNQITDISLDFLNSFPKLTDLMLEKNPIQNIPKEIFDNKYGNVLPAVRTYLESIL